MDDLKLGDEVLVLLNGGSDAPCLVIGTLHYAKDHEIVMVANGAAIGMPIHICWLQPTGNKDERTASELRQRYSDRFGAHWFKEI